MVKKIFKIIGIFILGVFGGIFADQILWPYFIERPLFYQYRLEQPPIFLTQKKEITIQENVAITDAIEKVEKVIVGVSTKTKTGETLEGSGLILTADGLSITLAELVPKSATSSIFVDGKLISVQILKRDTKENLVLIKIDKSNLPTCSFADLGKIKLGERVFLVGTIFKKTGLGKIVNEGIIKTFDENSIQTNILEDNDLIGSSLFDIEGNVLGINIIDKEGRVFTVPISKIKEFAGL